MGTSCSNDVPELESQKSIDSEIVLTKSSNEVFYSKDDINKKGLTNILLNISNDNQLVSSVHNYIKESLEYGLDEIVFVDEIMNPNKYTAQFSSGGKLSNYFNNIAQLSGETALRKENDERLSINELEIYWPYSEDWDGKSVPVITFISSDREGLEKDRENIDNYTVTAYRFTNLGKGMFKIDSLLVNEEYAMKNPVWVIRNQSVKVEDIIDLKKNHNFTKIYPRNEKLIKKNGVQVRATPYRIAETTVTSIKSEEQHDDWLNGGSEYHIYWFFPTRTFGLSTHTTGEIYFSRKEIKNKTTKDINFGANYDWESGQSHNRLKVLEYDPGKDTKYEVKFMASYKPKDSSTTYTGEYSTTITKNKTDDDIMDITIPRTAMINTQTKVNDNLYQKSFKGSGVTVNVKITGINGLEL
jgi:hypothetical protein